LHHLPSPSWPKVPPPQAQRLWCLSLGWRGALLLGPPLRGRWSPPLFKKRGDCPLSIWLLRLPRTPRGKADPFSLELSEAAVFLFFSERRFRPENPLLRKAFLRRCSFPGKSGPLLPHFLPRKRLPGFPSQRKAVLFSRPEEPKPRPFFSGVVPARRPTLSFGSRVSPFQVDDPFFPENRFCRLLFRKEIAALL